MAMLISMAKRLAALELLQLYLSTQSVNVDHCLGLVHQRHKLRQDSEKQLVALINDATIGW